MDFLEDNKRRLSDVLQEVRRERIDFVRLEYGDLSGISRCKIVPARRLEAVCGRGQSNALVNLVMDPACHVVPGTGLAEETGFGDGVFFPDLSTFRVVPWLPSTALVLTEPCYRGGAPVTSYPRHVARRLLQRLKEMGYSLLSAHEHEFYVVHADDTARPLHWGNMQSSLATFAGDGKLLYALSRSLERVGVDVETVEAEYSPGQVEITYGPAFGLRAADNAHLYRTVVKEVAQHRGYVASFMTKPWPERSGSSAHFNHSLWDADGRRNLMQDPLDESGISEIGRRWMAGILAHAPAISLLMAPTPNCQRRYKPCSFAPTNATWGTDNRTCALRLKAGDEAGTYLENRLSASGSNPYLTLAATVAAGMDGISKKLPLPARVTGDAYNEANVPPGTQDLPGSLQEALEAFQKDTVITEAFGAEFCKAFTAIKRFEIEREKEALARGDTEWEFRENFQVI